MTVDELSCPRVVTYLRFFGPKLKWQKWHRDVCLDKSWFVPWHIAYFNKCRFTCTLIVVVNGGKPKNNTIDKIEVLHSPAGITPRFSFKRMRESGMGSGV